MWFKRFKSGNVSVTDEVRPVRPVIDKVSAKFEKVEQVRYISSYEIVEELDVGHETVSRHLRNLTFGYHRSH